MAVAQGAQWDPEFARKSEWLWPIARAAEALSGCRDFPAHVQLDAMYAACPRARASGPLCFRPDTSGGKRKPPLEVAQRYDGRITLAGEVPTRERNWHDVLNALCFATFPNAKRALHARQYRAQCRTGVQVSARGEERDTLTLFDEGGVVAVAEPAHVRALEAAIAATDYARLRALERAGHALFVPFGHALFEHLIAGHRCPGASARSLVIDAIGERGDALLGAIDGALATELARESRFVRRAEAAHLRLEALRDGSE